MRENRFHAWDFACEDYDIVYFYITYIYKKHNIMYICSCHEGYHIAWLEGRRVKPSSPPTVPKAKA